MSFHKKILKTSKLGKEIGFAPSAIIIILVLENIVIDANYNLENKIYLSLLQAKKLIIK